MEKFVEAAVSEDVVAQIFGIKFSGNFALFHVEERFEDWCVSTDAPVRKIFGPTHVVRKDDMKKISLRPSVVSTDEFSARRVRGVWVVRLSYSARNGRMHPETRKDTAAFLRAARRENVR